MKKVSYKDLSSILNITEEDLLGVKVLGVKTIWYEQNINNKWKKKEEVLIEPDYKIRSMKELLDIL